MRNSVKAIIVIIPIVAIVVYFVYTQYRNEALAEEYKFIQMADCISDIGRFVCIDECMRDGDTRQACIDLSNKAILTYNL